MARSKSVKKNSFKSGINEIKLDVDKLLESTKESKKKLKKVKTSVKKSPKIEREVSANTQEAPMTNDANTLKIGRRLTVKNTKRTKKSFLAWVFNNNEL